VHRTDIDGRTDRRTESFLIARPRLHSMQCAKNYCYQAKNATSSRWRNFAATAEERRGGAKSSLTWGQSVFTALHWMHGEGGLVARKVSIWPSVKPVDCDKTEENSVHIFIPYERSFSLVFGEEEWLVGWPLLPEILGQTDRVGTKSLIFSRYSLVATQPWHLAKKSLINTNRKYTKHFTMSPRWSSYVAPKSTPKGGS